MKHLILASDLPPVPAWARKAPRNRGLIALEPACTTFTRRWGGGFLGCRTDNDGRTWYYTGLGAHPRAWWRDYCRKNNITLREYRRHSLKENE